LKDIGKYFYQPGSGYFASQAEFVRKWNFDAAHHQVIDITKSQLTPMIYGCFT